MENYPLSNLSKRPKAELVTEQLAVNLLSANMIQIKMGMVEFPTCMIFMAILGVIVLRCLYTAMQVKANALWATIRESLGGMDSAV